MLAPTELRPDPPAHARHRLLGQRGVVAWMTGLPSAGKSTVARGVERHLLAAGRLVYVLDGDEVRTGLNRDLGFAEQDRTENLRRLAEVARLFAEAGVIVLVAAISPLRRHRETARAVVGDERFLETFIHADVTTCERRDPKGNYARARAGQLPGFTGISAPYEEPERPDLDLDTRVLTIDATVQRLADALVARSQRAGS